MAKQRNRSKYGRKADPATGEEVWLKTCPNCTAEWGRPMYYPLEYFGVRYDGAVIQSWCSACRAKKATGKRQRNVESHEQAFLSRARQLLWIASQLKEEGATTEVKAPVLASTRQRSSEATKRVTTDGDCATETTATLVRGELGASTPKDMVESFHVQAADIVATLVEVYEAHVASGEVGREGAALASASPPVSGNCPIGTLYGRSQVGKSLAALLTAALAIDNGFRVVVVVTSENPRLVKQSVRRFRVIDGPLVYCPPDEVGNSLSWLGEEENIERRLSRRGVVFICPKDEVSLRRLIAFLRDVCASGYPALILEDDADPAEPVETVPPQLSGRSLLGTSHLIFENGIPGQKGESLREVLPHHVMLRLTSAPSALVQGETPTHRSSFVIAVEPGPGYVGGEEIILRQERFLVHIPDDEPLRLAAGGTTLPTGMACSLTFFMLSALARGRSGGLADVGAGSVYLCHFEGTRPEVDRFIRLITEFTNDLADQLEDDFGSALERRDILWAYRELSQTVAGLPGLDEMLTRLSRLLPARSIIGLHHRGEDIDPTKLFTFIVGGSRLVRGLTIENLLVTYPVDLRRMSRADALLQHSLMFGYRKDALAYSRFFLTKGQAERFRAIYEKESALLDLVRPPS